MVSSCYNSARHDIGEDSIAVEQAQATLEGGRVRILGSLPASLLHQQSPACTPQVLSLLATVTVGRESGIDGKSCDDGHVAMGAGGGYHWEHLVTNLYIGPPGCDGHLMLNDSTIRILSR
ncbi:unnamed protein product [Leuciscus chuanchicus]